MGDTFVTDLYFTESAVNTGLDNLVPNEQEAKAALLEQKRMIARWAKSVESRMKTRALEMMHTLGYSGTLKQCEKELNKNIASLQAETAFLNGEKLAEFLIRDLKRTEAFKIEDQKNYDAFLEDFRNKIKNDDATLVSYLKETSLDKKFDKKIKKAINKDIQEWTPELLEVFYNYLMSLLNSNNSKPSHWYLSDTSQTGTMRGRQMKIDKNGKLITAGGSGVAVSITENMSSINSRVRKAINNYIHVSKITVNSNKNKTSILFKGSLSRELTLSLLKLTYDSKNNNISQLEAFCGNNINLFTKVKNSLKKILKSEYTGSNPLYNQAVDDFFSAKEKMTPTDLFGGENAVRNLTGLLGEFQAFYYFYVLTNGKKISVAWTGHLKADGKKPHADLVLNKIIKGKSSNFGIQVKNSISDAMQAINFQSTEYSIKNATELENYASSLKFARKNPIQNIPIEFQETFQKIANILAIRDFNIQYGIEEGVMVNQEGEEGHPFHETRERILSLAKEAEKISSYFAAAMMFMSFTQDDEDKELPNNTLFIIGGKMAITSATIFMNILKELNSTVRSFNLDSGFVLDNHNKGKTIIDYSSILKSNRSRLKMKMQSSYTF